MTNVSSTAEKVATRRGLFEFGIQTLEKDGWKVSRIARGGKASLRQITKGSKTHKVSIRTSQDTWIAFPRKTKSDGWITLDDVDYVMAVSVDDRHSPTEARAHMIPADEARARFDRAYAARKEANYKLPVGRGLWISLYDKEATDPVNHVGAGLGLDYPPLDVRSIKDGFAQDDGAEGEGEGEGEDMDDEASNEEPKIGSTSVPEAPLTIPEAKRRLADTLGVPVSAIKITVEH